jgi:hypothetical protein
VSLDCELPKLPLANLNTLNWRLSFAKTPQNPEFRPGNMLWVAPPAIHFICILSFGEGQPLRRIGLRWVINYCFVDVLLMVLSKKFPTVSANCCGTVSMALCC